MSSGSIIRSHLESLARWGITANPFSPVPPSNPELLSEVFTDRRKELIVTLPTLYQGGNVLIEGAYGIGKTVFLLETLRRMQRETTELDSKFMNVFVHYLGGENPDDFYRTMLWAIADTLAGNGDSTAQRVRDALIGSKVTYKKGRRFTSGVTAYLFSATGEISRGRDESVTLDSPKLLLLELLEHAKSEYDRLVFAIDEFEKMDIQTSSEILRDAAQILEDDKVSFAFIMAQMGTRYYRQYPDVFGQFESIVRLTPLSQKNLIELATKYLNTVRTEPRDDGFPFTIEALKFAAQISQGFPRMFIVICQRVLAEAAYEKCDTIDVDEMHRLTSQTEIRWLQRTYSESDIDELSKAVDDAIPDIQLSAMANGDSPSEADQ